MHAPVRHCAHAEEAVRGSDIVVIATNALTPVIQTGWLQPGQYVCTVRHCEIAPETFARFDVLAVNSRDNLGPTTFVARNQHGPLPPQVLLDIEKGYPPGDAVNIDWPRIGSLDDYTRTINWEAGTSVETFDREPGLAPASWKYGLGWQSGTPTQARTRQMAATEMERERAIATNNRNRPLAVETASRPKSHACRAP